MKASILMFTILLILSSCNTKETVTPLYITTKTSTGPRENIKQTDVISVVDTDYFEVSLSELANEPSYIATKVLVRSDLSKEFKFVFFNITDKAGVDHKFDSSTDFLNFMSERGYDLVEQKKNKGE